MAFSDYFKRDISIDEDNQETVSKAIAFVVTQQQQEQLKQLFSGAPIKDCADLLDRLQRTQTVRMEGGIQFTLPPEDLHQLKQQSLGMGIPYEQYVKEFVEDSVSLQLNGCYKHGRW